jgi:uncharacterized surface protein with fasciclin (FAS1) repeats
LNLIQRANLVDTINDMHRITIFVPSSEAIATANTSSSTPSQIRNFIYSYIVPDFLGYLPQLTDGRNLTTLANTTIKIAIRDHVYFVNGVEILDPDLITDNGVMHLIDGVS